MKLWQGRFQKELDSAAHDFNSSFSFDVAMFREDVTGSLAHAEMLAATGILSGEDAAQLKTALQTMLAEYDAGTLDMSGDYEDVHSFVEATLTARVGDAGKRLHTARSRNDQVALDLRLWLRNQCGDLQAAILVLAKALVALADANIESIMPGYTHLQVAQPVTFAHHLMAYAQMLKRDHSRLADWYARANECPLGAGALAGTTHPIDRAMTAEALGFAAPCANSMDAVSDRDFVVELAADLSMVMMHLSRLSEEVILWCSSEFRFVELDDAYSTGSSIMPQKKNPDIAELIRGKTGRVYGNLTALLTTLKGLPLCYNKDMQEDKPAIFDAVDSCLACLRLAAPMVRTMKARPDNMRAAAARGFINATDCADYLAKKGVPFRDAYKITGELVAHCVQEGTVLEKLPIAVFQKASPVFAEDVYDAINLDTCVTQRKSEGGPAPQAVQKQIADYKRDMGF